MILHPPAMALFVVELVCLLWSWRGYCKYVASSRFAAFWVYFHYEFNYLFRKWEVYVQKVCGISGMECKLTM